MRFYSTNHRTAPVSFQEAVMKGMPEDQGLYMPENIPVFSDEFFKKLPRVSFQQIAFEVSRNIIEKEIPEGDLMDLIQDAFDFNLPVVNIYDNIYVLELFHGPTLAFKDYGARFMARLVGYFLKHGQREINILVATSGDTGSAVAQGFYGVEGIKVTLLYPKNKVSRIQEQQLTTVGGNVCALEVDGTFDDCQKMVKRAFIDKDLSNRMVLSSANSINIARLLPQSFYYIYGVGQLMENSRKIKVCVPSGNFGNLCGGLMAKKMGLPVQKFIAATNINDVVPEYLASGLFKSRPSQKTISNAMDVGNPSNFARMMDLYDGDWEKIRTDISGAHYTDDETRTAIKQVYSKYNYLMCPHTAIGYMGISQALEDDDGTTGMFLSTAHPAKFGDIVEPLIGQDVDMPARLKKIINRKKVAIPISRKYEDFKAFLMEQS